MRTKQLTESELFRTLNILLTDKNKQQLENLKEKASLLADVEIDNSGLIRGLIDYYDTHPEELKKVVSYIKELKGYNILMKLNEMIAENKSDEDIEKELGIGTEIINKVKESYFNDTKKTLK